MKNVMRSLFAGVILLGLLLSASFGCTDIVAGKDATVDGSVVTSQTADGSFYNARVEIVPGGKHVKGEMAPVYWNITNEEYGPPVKIGEIPQVEETYAHYRFGYPCLNEHGLAIGETTIGQKEELKTFRPDARAIMTIEQLASFALQRTKTAREAIVVMGNLAETYGFLPSCIAEGECLTVADSDEAWIFEVRSTGMMWTPESGKPGAVWVAQRVPDDMVVVVPNMSRIQEIDPEDTDNFMVAEHYKSYAIEAGLYDPDSGKPFIWQDVYSPATGNDDWSMASMWIRNRLYSIHKALAPSRKWDPYAETRSYPFAIKPEKKISVQDVIALLRGHHEGSVFDMYEDPAWYVKDGDEMVKSELATPFPSKALRKLLNIPYNRPTAKWDCAYSFVSQSRRDVPDPLRTILWFGFDNPHTTCYVPIYNGITETPKSWRTFDRNAFDLNSTQWAFMLADDLVVNRNYAKAMEDLKAVRDSLEQGLFEKVGAVDAEATKLYSEDPAKAEAYLTKFVNDTMIDVEKLWWNLNWTLISKYTNNK